MRYRCLDQEDVFGVRSDGTGRCAVVMGEGEAGLHMYIQEKQGFEEAKENISII